MPMIIKWLHALFMLPLSAGLIYFSMHWRTAELAAYRSLSGALFTITTLSTLTWITILIRRSSGGDPFFIRLVKSAAVFSSAALLIFLTREFHFQWIRYSVLNADPVALSRLGSHFVVGYRSQGFVEELIERKGTAGIFITAHNVRGRDADSIRGELEGFKARHHAGNAKPLWIATDQEGGHVSRMTPPLAVQPALGQLVSQHAHNKDLETIVRTYGTSQGTALAALGINLNFAPVVDINYHIVNRDDRYTRIYQRAISSDPHQVERVAGWYCDALFDSGVRCTLKHFPGLGRVHTDTHLDSARLDLPIQVLTESDWLPFKGLMQPGHHPFTMLSHVQLEAVDPTKPVSTSKQVVNDLLRTEWHYNGILITDDFSMGAITQRQGGIGSATVDALNAGVDLILISYDPEQYYMAMYALLEAERNGKIDSAMLDKSRARLDEVTRP